MRPETLRHPGNQPRVFQRGRVDGNLVGAPIQNVFRVLDATYAARDTEWYVEQGSNITDPVAIDRPAIRAGRNIIEHEFICTGPAITISEIEDLTDNAVIAKLDTLDDLAVANVEAGNYSAGRNDAISSALIFPSSNARPLIAAGTPAARNAFRSPIARTPPDACN